MEPPKAKDDKKLGSIYFSGKCVFTGPYELKGNEVFEAEGGNKAMRAALEAKKGIKANIHALPDSLNLKRKSVLGKKPPYKNLGFKHIKHYYQFAQQETIVILAVQMPKKPKQYIALKFDDASTTAKFCDIVQYALVAPNNNLKNAAKMPQPPVVNAPGPETSENPAAPPSMIEQTAVSPATSQTPSASESRSSSSTSLSQQLAKATPLSITPITEIIEREPVISRTQSRDGSIGRNSQLFATSSKPLPGAVLVESRTPPPTIKSSSPTPQALSPQPQTPSESRTSRHTPTPVEGYQIPSQDFEENPPNNLCPRCSGVHESLVHRATSPVPIECSYMAVECADKSTDSPHQLTVQSDAPDQTATNIQPMISSTVNSSHPRQVSGVTEYFTYCPDHGKSSESNHDPNVIEKVICIEKGRQTTALTTPDLRTSSSSSPFSDRYLNSVRDTPDEPSGNQMILASNNFHPLSVLTNDRSRKHSLNDMCSICGSVGEGGPMQLRVIRVDVDGQPKISPDGTVYMYSSTKQVRPDNSENVNGYQRESSSYHNDDKYSKEEKKVEKTPQEKEYRIHYFRLDSSGSSSDSEDSISGGPTTGGTFNIRHL